MNFANPAWLWALLLLVPLFGLRFWAQMASGKSLAGLVAPRLQPLLVSRTSQIRHWLAFSFLMLGLAGLIVALARPQLGFEEVESYSEGRSMILAIDTSRSMLANDLVPNRLERAKLAARDIVDSMPEDRIGLMAFAGKAFMQAPLTNDHEAVIESIEQLDTDIIPRGGTNLTSAAELALKSFQEADAKQNALIIFSDGEALEGQEQVESIKEKANREKMIIVTIGVGTEKGSIIPEPGPDGQPQEGVFIKDDNGQVIRSRLDSSALRELATGGGIYLQLGDRASLTRVVKTITENLTTTREEDEAQQRPIERFMWPLSFGVCFLIMSHLVHLLFRSGFRRMHPSALPAGVGVLVLGCCGMFLSEVRAEDAWEKIEGDSYVSALKDFESALNREKINEREKTDIHLGIGSASYRMGDYEKASKAFGEALIRRSKRTREQAHYNLGNTLYRKGETTLYPSRADPEAPQAMAPDPDKIEATLRQWIGALEHYEAALEINRKNADAQHNIEVVKKKIDELKQEQEQQKQEEEQKKEEEKQDPEKDQEEKEDDQKDEGGEENEKDQPKDDEDNPDDPDQEKKEGEEDEPKDGEGDDKKDGENSEQDKDQKGDPGENGEQEKPDEPKDGQPGEEEPPQPPDPGDGELTADDSQPKPAQPNQKDRAAESKTNPDTGYSPSEARQLIEALADEDGELRPVYPRPYRAERYKNW